MLLNIIIENGDDIEEWTLEELKQMVHKFQEKNNPNRNDEEIKESIESVDIPKIPEENKSVKIFFKYRIS